MICGIDLGTTMSLIGSGSDMYSNLVSSSVDVSTGQQVDRDFVSKDVVSSYKTNMSIGESGELSVKCSTIILKKLVSIAERRSGEKVDEVVISVPAYFSTSQREAVIKAAYDGGIKVRTLINEPTAAALFVCRNVQDLIVVFDLGGGTFDVTVIDSRAGTYSVVATAGTILGGDDFDLALTEFAIKQCKIQVRYQTKLNRAKIKSKMRLLKERIQKSGTTEYEDLSEFGAVCDCVVTLEDYKRIMKEVFWKTVVMTQEVISKNIPVSEKPKLVFVGGSSSCPYLKEMVNDELHLDVVECQYNPDLIVAKGVALYAGLVEAGTADDILEDVTKRLCIEDEKGCTITIIEDNSYLPCSSSRVVHNTEKAKKLELKLYQGNKLLAADNDYIGTLIYNYDEEVEAGEGIVEVEVSVSVSGVVSLSAYNVLYGEVSRQEIELSAR